MNAEGLARITDLVDILTDAGYQCSRRETTRGESMLVGENAYGLVAIVEATALDTLEQLVSDAQAELTRFVVSGRVSTLRWDLYVFALAMFDPVPPHAVEVADDLESDTRYARKFVKVNLSRDAGALDQALRPLLPLRTVPATTLTDPLELMRERLTAAGVPEIVATGAIDSFLATGEVTVP